MMTIANVVLTFSRGVFALVVCILPAGNFTMMGWRIDPDGLYKEIKRVGDRYGKPMMITENGIATPDDAKRVWYMRNHIAAIWTRHS
jgi:beta-glucosidase/6-phospho-beta-glucosidase/beta-galactosidase